MNWMTFGGLTRRRLAIALACGVMTLSLAKPAHAQFGIRAGAGAKPDQFFFGAHTETRPLAPRVSFRPNIEVGVGDELTLVALNLEFAFRFPVSQHRFSIYAGAGPAANIYSDTRNGPGDDGGVAGGLNFLVGVQHDGGLFTEFKVGAIDSPRVKFTVGYVFTK